MTKADVFGSVVVPAHDEESVVETTLSSLVPLVAAGSVEVIVVCNGCTDRTADVARRLGVRVVELELASKIAALNVGDEYARFWPRIYLDADIRLESSTVLALLKRLADGPVLAARPRVEFDTSGASWPVRSYYRARNRLPGLSGALWGAGIYGISQVGHARFERFPDVTADDLWVDKWFAQAEKEEIDAPPVVVSTPRTVSGLFRILHRTYRGNREIARSMDSSGVAVESPTSNLIGLFGRSRGIREHADAFVYVVLAFLGRLHAVNGRNTRTWERDESSRVVI